jgi:Xaa-Pro aminopeptidase
MSTPVRRLVDLLKKHNLKAYIIPSADAHQSEYVAECDTRRAYISGFTGSAGTAVVTTIGEQDTTTNNEKDSELPHRLWTDARYFLQAEKQLDLSQWVLMKAGLPQTPKIEDWLIKTFPTKTRVGVDTTIMSASSYESLSKALEDRLELVQFNEHETLVDQIWDSRPSRPSTSLRILGEERTGQSSDAKLEKIRAKMKEQSCSFYIVSALDEVAWLFNLRGADVPLNPVFFAYAVIEKESVTLYIDQGKITDAVRSHLPKGITIQSYESFYDDLKNRYASQTNKENKVWVDMSKCNYAIFSSFNKAFVHKAESPISLLKAVKNEVEVTGIRNAHVRDGAALVEFLAWLDQEIRKSGVSLTECSISDRLEEFRAKQKDFVGLSFETIAGSGPNGAIIHYKPEPSTCAAVTTDQMLLLDSGAQYIDGTTDVTRTVHFGTPTPFEIRAFTRVLQGHIALASVIFPPGTVGPCVDVLARAPLWDDGLDYLHGTGHGVGAFLNVHEGPHGISSTARSFSVLTTPLESGMVVTNEPGYYHEASAAVAGVEGSDKGFGIRIESVLVVKPVQTTHKFNGRQYLGFETITYCPIQKSLIDKSLMTEKEIKWLNQYHAECREKLTPLLSGYALEWLNRSTEPL